MEAENSAYTLNNLKTVVGFPDSEKPGTFMGIDIGAVQYEIQVPVKAVEDHTMAAVFVIDKAVGVTPGAADGTAVADGQSLNIPVLRPRMETGPQHIQFPVSAFPEEGAVGNKVAGSGIHQ